MDVEVLSRIQFAFTIAFHYIYPPLSIGLGLLMVCFEGAYLRTGERAYHDLARFWTRIFAITFGLGVATGIVMEFEFGTNWAVYSRFVGDVFGSALAAEGVFAFALESGFLGILLFGWDRVKPWVHFVATVGVFLGSMFSAIWIVVANSWMHTPAGFELVGEGLDVRAEITDFWAMVFNPSALERLIHVYNGAFMAGAMVVVSVHVYYLLRGRHEDLSRRALRIAVPVALATSCAAPASGHLAAEILAVYQPAKLAAIEGHYETGPMPLGLLGWVDQDAEETYALEVPGGVSWLIHRDFSEPMPGLYDYPEEDRPGQVNAIYQFYHLMVACGFAMIMLLTGAMLMYVRGELTVAGFATTRASDPNPALRDATGGAAMVVDESPEPRHTKFGDALVKYLPADWRRGLGWALVVGVVLPQIANQTGWYAAEMGRQPWVVYGLLRTSDALSEAVVAEQVLFSLIGFTLVYLVLFLLFVYLMNKKIQHGPDEGGGGVGGETDHRPLTRDIAGVVDGV